MIQYVILGTSHEIQNTSRLEKPVTGAIQEHAIRLVAEEHPLDTASMVCITTKRLHIPYLQVDLFPEEWREHGIEREMNARDQFPGGQDVRLSHADRVREDFWLEKIEASEDRGPVLIICGYLHLAFLADNIRERGDKVVGLSTFPADLLDRKPTKILSPTELEEH